MQKIKKKYRTVKAVGPERTDERTYETEFIGSFRSLKTSGEPKNIRQLWLTPICSNFVFSHTNQSEMLLTIYSLVFYIFAKFLQYYVLLFFGSPDVFRLRKEPINSLLCVRTYVRTYVSSGPTALIVWYFVLFFCMKLGLHTTSNDIKSHNHNWKNHTLYAGKVLILRNFGHLRPKFGHFLPKLTVLRAFDL